MHPRPKDLVGRRLAQAAFVTAYGGPGPASGPVLSGCRLEGSTLTLTFNATLLRGESVAVGNSSAALENTALYVLINASLPADAAANHHSGDWRTYAGP